MPAGNGVTVFERLQRNTQQLAGVPIIFMSAYPPDHIQASLPE